MVIIQERLMDRLRTNITKMMNDPSWVGQPFWLMNLMQYKVGVDGTTTIAQEAMREYLTLSREKATRISGDDLAWFKRIRLLSLNAVSIFPDTHGQFDCVIIFEYASPEEFVKEVLHSSKEEEFNRMRGRAIDYKTMVQVACKPTPLHNPSDSTFTLSAHSFRTADVYYASHGGAEDLSSRLSESQEIWPNPGDIMPLVKNKGGKYDDLHKLPLFALNLLRFRNREKYKEYGASVSRVIAKDMPKPSGPVIALSPCMTLNDGTQWDEIAMMQYPNLRGFVGLASLPGYKAESEALR